MNKKFFIIGGLAVILLLLGVWVYLLVYGAPESAEDIFADLGTEGGVAEEGVVDFTPVVEEEPLVNVAASRLRQLTTGPVAGYKEVQVSTTTPALLYYVEMGTGHVYTINTESGETIRVSATTFPQTLTAEISNNGLHYAFLSAGATKSAPLSIGTISTSTQSITRSFEGTATDIKFNDQSELYILSRNGDTSSAATHSLQSNSSSPLFTIPFLEAVVDWGNVKGGSHLVYPKPAEAFEGQLYEVSENSFVRLPIQGLGFAAIKSGDITLYNVIKDKRLQSYLYVNSVGYTEALDSVVLVDKCTAVEEEGVFICAQDRSKTNLRSQDSWYTGEISFSDSVWMLDGNSFTGELLFDGMEESGRQLDIIKLGLNSNREVLYFINKLDNTLWMYEL